jgi:membrane protein
LEWDEDNVPRLAAALSYYTIFSLAPLLVIAIAISGLVFGREAAQGEIVGEIRGLVGENAAQAIQDAIANAGKLGTSVVAGVIGILMLLFGATGVFGELQGALNTIWEVKPKPGRGLGGIIRDRFFSFTLVLGTSFLLLVSLLISAALAALNKYFFDALPGADMIWQTANVVVSFSVITFLFAVIFKFVPDVKVKWHDVWIGAAITALLFNIGKYLIGLYLGHSSVGSTYGAAGSLVIILIWVYYSAQILFLGAEFTQVYTRRNGSGGKVAENALPLTEKARKQQGIPHKQSK